MKFSNGHCWQSERKRVSFIVSFVHMCVVCSRHITNIPKGIGNLSEILDNIELVVICSVLATMHSLSHSCLYRHTYNSP